MGMGRMSAHDGLREGSVVTQWEKGSQAPKKSSVDGMVGGWRSRLSSKTDFQNLYEVQSKVTLIERWA